MENIKEKIGTIEAESDSISPKELKAILEDIKKDLKQYETLLFKTLPKKLEDEIKWLEKQDSNIFNIQVAEAKGRVDAVGYILQEIKAIETKNAS